jgi:hypothetical protein
MLVEARRGWRIHVTVYAIVITSLTVLNVLLVTLGDAGFIWFPFPLAGWGVGVAMHYRYGVRHVDELIAKRQEKIERLAHRATHVAA